MNLASLAELDSFKVADEDPDPRGWDLVGGDGQSVGRVDDLVVDTDTMKVRYLSCTTDGVAARQDGRRVLVPPAFARLDAHGHRVIVDTLTSEQLTRLPAYSGLPITAHYENTVQRAFVVGSVPEGNGLPPESSESPERSGKGDPPAGPVPPRR